MFLRRQCPVLRAAMSAFQPRKVGFSTPQCRLFNPAMSAFQPRNVGFSAPQCRLFIPAKADLSKPEIPCIRITTGSAPIFVPTVPLGCRRVSAKCIPARSARAHVIRKSTRRGGSLQTLAPEGRAPVCTQRRKTEINLVVQTILSTFAAEHVRSGGCMRHRKA